MEQNRWTYLLFGAGALVLFYLLRQSGEWAWSFYGNKPNDWILLGGSAGVAALAGLLALKNERVFVLATEVTAELKKVTWPTRKETVSATIVVIVTCIVSALFLGVFDATWSYLTRYITP
jgi:preprotein translocase subunit SecE